MQNFYDIDLKSFKRVYEEISHKIKDNIHYARKLKFVGASEIPIYVYDDETELYNVPINILFDGINDLNKWRLHDMLKVAPLETFIRHEAQCYKLQYHYKSHKIGNITCHRYYVLKIGRAHV